MRNRYRPSKSTASLPWLLVGLCAFSVGPCWVAVEQATAQGAHAIAQVAIPSVDVVLPPAGDAAPYGDAKGRQEDIWLPDDNVIHVSTTAPDWVTDGNTDGPAETTYFPVDAKSACLQDPGVWGPQVRVGYDDGFLIASDSPSDLQASNFPFRLRINGFSQLRNLGFESSDAENSDQRQFQLQRARLIFAGNAFNPDLQFFLQLDGRSSSGDDFRVLDFYLDYDIGHDLWGYAPGRLGILAGKFKMPFQLARWLSGQNLQFTDRSMSSMYFDVNRSIAWGLHGRTRRTRVPVFWEAAIFNGLVTGGAETGSSGDLDNNFAYSCRLYAFPIGQWGDPSMGDLTFHKSLATRIGFGFASSTINADGSTEFESVRVVDSGETLASLLAPLDVSQYTVSLLSVDASFKFRGLATTLEYYFRNINHFDTGSLPALFDHGLWLQTGYFVVPEKLELLARWSTVTGNSGTLGQEQESSAEVAGGIGWYINGHNSKLTVDLTHLDGAPINSSALNIFPGYAGWLYRAQVQISF